MHIIFGQEQADELSTRYTVLELDTFQIGVNGPTMTAYCVIEMVPFGELAALADTQTQHQHLMINYKLQNWQDCLIAVEQLQGKWRGELDTFYADLRSRVNTHIKNPPSTDWSSVILKPVS
jgi:hypothetical protein